MKPLVCILTHAHVCYNPRVLKEALLFQELGYEVKILTIRQNDDFYKQDLELIPPGIEVIHYADLTLPSLKTKCHKILRKLATLLVQKFGLQLAAAMGYGYYNLLSKASNFEASLYVCHQEAGLLAGIYLLKKGKKVAFDFEDWYSEDLPESARKSRPIKLLKQAEKTALQKGSYCITTSASMAQKMAAAYNVQAPKIIYNTFEQVNFAATYGRVDRIDLKTASLIWFSQTVGPGRGLELLIAACNLVQEPIQLHLRGTVSTTYKNALTEQLKNKHHQLFFHPMVKPSELPFRLAEHDIGLALEQNSPESRNLTITNKVMQYLQAGLAVIASDTEGQKEIAAKTQGSILLFPNNHAEILASIIESLIKDRFKLQHLKNTSLKSFNQCLSWEYEKLNYEQIITAPNIK